MPQACRLLVLALESGCDPSTQGVDPDDLPELVLRLQAALIRSWDPDSEASTASEVLAWLRRLDQLHGDPPPSLPPSAAPYALPSAPELAVELAHDFRSPLTSVLFLAESLRSGQSGGLNPIQRQQLGIIHGAALSLVTMAGDVIDLARGEDPDSEGGRTPFSLPQLLESVRDLLLPMADARGVQVSTSAPESACYLGSPVPLGRVLLNLGKNALEATESGMVEITARSPDDGRMEFSVRDTGRGLDEEMRDHLFKPFRTRGTNSTLGFSGSGLGLTICQRLVAMMGGELDFESEPGSGTRFFFTIPLPPL